MGMFQSPYDKGGALSKEAYEERKKVYMDRRGEESRKKAGRRLFLFYLPLLPLTLLPGFFSEAAVSHTAYLLLPYALEAVTVVLTGVGLLSFLFHAKATVDGRVYRLQFQRFLGRAAMSCILGIGFFLVELFFLFFVKAEKKQMVEIGVLLIQFGFLLFSRLFWMKAKEEILNWTL